MYMQINAFVIYMAQQSIITLYMQHILQWGETVIASGYIRLELFATHTRFKYFQQAVLCSSHYETHGQSTVTKQFD